LTELKYIAIEGVIGAGKSSLAQLLADKLKANIIANETVRLVKQAMQQHFF